MDLSYYDLVTFQGICIITGKPRRQKSDGYLGGVHGLNKKLRFKYGTWNIENYEIMFK
jgi:hypothetical protein